ncbi:hypothetical protein DPX16_6575 [Anabarilius grahami]|uniref:Uncharacterized protein n=1 Tax=Anabarilius grahami TaxID=495550 RepID=A0A3N0XY03_ANAGA|nr:hypothetical protein DPX16_6575 [Anabarilius grahami]
MYKGAEAEERRVGNASREEREEQRREGEEKRGKSRRVQGVCVLSSWPEEHCSPLPYCTLERPLVEEQGEGAIMAGEKAVLRYMMKVLLHIVSSLKGCTVTPRLERVGVGSFSSGNSESATRLAVQGLSPPALGQNVLAVSCGQPNPDLLAQARLHSHVDS